MYPLHIGYKYDVIIADRCDDDIMTPDYAYYNGCPEEE